MNFLCRSWMSTWLTKRKEACCGSSHLRLIVEICLQSLDRYSNRWVTLGPVEAYFLWYLCLKGNSRLRVYLGYLELFQRGRSLIHDIQTQVLDAVDGVDSGVTAIEPSYNQLKAASMSSWNWSYQLIYFFHFILFHSMLNFIFIFKTYTHTCTKEYLYS